MVVVLLLFEIQYILYQHLIAILAVGANLVSAGVAALTLLVLQLVVAAAVAHAVVV